ncbi:MAG: hypothetical protein HLUCCX10_07190 [Algoriphagus marincola HL-49]|uniref:DUF4468 domain-containing protein n=1 Tax=Algoriphagus marincola HL-49 TaxID=1305737 RepID=A0A0P7YNT2_9BACT|nr:MAG: hypothetical protein HLUCCX10_07190 [Algoriphagus marincola HL-49]
MKKVKLSILVLVLGILTSMTQVSLKDNAYFPMELSEEVTFKYTDTESFVKNIDLKEKKLLGGKEYSVRLIQYSWGKNDTTYFRTENEIVYYYDEKSNTESVEIPNDFKVGMTWTSTDNAWKYEITSIKAKLKTPEKKYRNLLEIKATQLQNRDKTKLTEYLNYYKKNVGNIASVTNGKLMTYKLEKKP